MDIYQNMLSRAIFGDMQINIEWEFKKKNRPVSKQVSGHLRWRHLARRRVDLRGHLGAQELLL